MMLYTLDKDFLKNCLKDMQRTKGRHGQSQVKYI